MFIPPLRKLFFSFIKKKTESKDGLKKISFYSPSRRQLASSNISFFLGFVLFCENECAIISTRRAIKREMKTKRRAIDSLKRSKKETTSYLITLILSATLLFLFINIQNDQNFVKLAGNTTRSIDNAILGGFTLLIAIICAINCYVANTYFLKAKNQELCVYLSCGMKITVLAKFLITQNFIILAIAVPLGGLLACILNPIMNFIILSILGIQGALFTINLKGFLMWILILFFEMFFLILINIGYTYTNELKHMLDENCNTKLPDNRSMKIPPVLYWLLAIIAVGVLLFVPAKMNYLSVGAVLSLMAIQGIIKVYLPKHQEKKKQKHNKIQCESIVIQGNLNALMKTSFMYCLLISGTVIGISCIVVVTTSYLSIILLIAYALAILLMGASIYFKIMIEALKRKDEFEQLSLLGFHQTSIKYCIHKELTKFYGYLVFFPLPFAGIIGMRYVLTDQISIFVLIFIFAVLCGYFFILLKLSIKAYEDCILTKEIKEETTHA